MIHCQLNYFNLLINVIFCLSYDDVILKDLKCCKMFIFIIYVKYNDYVESYEFNIIYNMNCHIYLKTTVGNYNIVLFYCLLMFSNCNSYYTKLLFLLIFLK